MSFGLRMTVAILVVLSLGLVLTFEFPTVQSVQVGYRGTGMEQVYNRLALENKVARTVVPEPTPAVDLAGQPASAVYTNVQVLRDVDANEFLRLMTAMTEWVSPQQGCAYCHSEQNLADDTMYTHKVSRRMIEMTRHINGAWKNHVGETGVTCFGCHRGQPVPANIWFSDPGHPPERGQAGNAAGQNAGASSVAYSSLPYDPFTPFLGNRNDIRVISDTALPEGNRRSIKQTEWTYGLMMHMSSALGVNCTFCHNTRSFMDWEQSSPARIASWYGIRMTQDLNVNYLEPLRPVYPPARLGSLGDAPKANCATCHQGAYKPLYGLSMVKDHPALIGPAAAQPAAAPAGAPRQ